MGIWTPFFYLGWFPLQILVEGVSHLLQWSSEWPLVFLVSFAAKDMGKLNALWMYFLWTLNWEQLMQWRSTENSFWWWVTAEAATPGSRAVWQGHSGSISVRSGGGSTSHGDYWVGRCMYVHTRLVMWCQSGWSFANPLLLSLFQNWTSVAVLWTTQHLFNQNSSSRVCLQLRTLTNTLGLHDMRISVLTEERPKLVVFFITKSTFLLIILSR